LQRGGAVLELGCGSGRILLPLLASGIDIEGIDQSPGMLRQLQREALSQRLAPMVRLGTLTDFAVSRQFTTVLCPYSVMTYLTAPAELTACLIRIRQALLPEGLLALDTFIPRNVVAFGDFRLDYRRPHGALTLQREKRISAEGPCNRIERRYTLLHDDGSIERSWTTCDLIRPWTEAELVASAERAGLRCVERTHDFGAHSPAPQFMVLHFAGGRHD
ncbi:MAG TPA: class I SAM-dependent methyltransferase, partial [Candidatus Acidoferrum sp.]|nr:class I SAM-dependent methyltransferase [Candidatus Acidoferrum sp.]